MLVPEAPVDEDHGAVLRQHQVRCARQIAAMEAESVPEPVDEASDCDFGERVRCLHAGHDGAALVGREPIVHLVCCLPHALCSSVLDLFQPRARQQFETAGLREQGPPQSG